jgi:hypothetical protein
MVKLRKIWFRRNIMKKILGIFLIVCIGIFLSTGISYAKKYSIPFNKTPYVKYKKGGQIKLQKGYFKPSTGKYVAPYFKTYPDNYKFNNLKQ